MHVINLVAVLFHIVQHLTVTSEVSSFHFLLNLIPLVQIGYAFYLCNMVLSSSTSTSKCFESVRFLTVFNETIHLDAIFVIVKYMCTRMDTIKALIPIGQFVRDTLCKELTSETCCTFKCCISGLHAVCGIIIGQLFQIRGVCRGNPTAVAHRLSFTLISHCCPL